MQIKNSISNKEYLAISDQLRGIENALFGHRWNLVHSTFEHEIHKTALRLHLQDIVRQAQEAINNLK
jgi:hypothetical protein